MNADVVIVTLVANFLVIVANLPPNYGTELRNYKTLMTEKILNNFYRKMVGSIAFYFYAAAARIIDNTPVTSIEIVAFVMLIFFVAIRIWSYRELGPMFTYALCIQRDHTLVETGPYKYLVHPSYTGQIGAAYMFIFLTGTWLNPFALGITLYAIYMLPARMDEEEKMMHAEFGQAYENYLESRYRLIPYVY